jgi:uncharacterized membrane protein
VDAKLGRVTAASTGRAFGLRIATGAMWGLAAGGLLVARLPQATALAVLGLGAVLGAVMARVHPSAEALAHPGLAVVAALCGASMTLVPEPTFFLLVPLVGAALYWPLGAPSADEKPLPAWAMPALFAAAATVLFWPSAQRHWSFASGRDLALFYQTQWLMAHGQPLLNTVIGMPPFADHLTLDDFLMAPLLRLHDSAVTLLFVQAVAVASAVFPIHALTVRLVGRPRLGGGLAVAWVLAPDVHMGVMFDFNPTPLASALILWTAWALVLRGPVAVVVLTLVACAAKTNIAVYVAVLALTLSLRAIDWRRGAAVATLAVAIAVLELAVVFPWFRAGGFRHWKYEELGDSPREIALSLATRPGRAAALLVDHPQKRRSLLLPLAGTGYLGMADPLSLVLQLPNWGERFLASHRVRWWGYYYGMPAVATALVGAMLGARRLQAAGRAGPRLGHYVAACALLSGVFPPYRTPDGDYRSPLYAWRRPHAASDEDVRTQREALRFIGKDPRLKVAAQYNLLPHLAGRPYIYELEHAPEADVVALHVGGGTYPDGRPAWRRRVQEIWATGRFHVAFCQGQTVVLYRGPEMSAPCPSWEALMAGTDRPGPEAPLPDR